MQNKKQNPLRFDKLVEEILNEEKIPPNFPPEDEEYFFQKADYTKYNPNEEHKRMTIPAAAAENKKLTDAEWLPADKRLLSKKYNFKSYADIKKYIKDNY